MTRSTTPTGGRIAILVAALGLILASFGFGASAASAQGVCDEYSSLPQCQGSGPSGGAENNGPGNGLAPNEGAGNQAGTGTAGEGSLPFTGYPLTPLLLLLLGLLTLGLATRGTIALRDRAARASSAHRLR
jgi:hypothetical protein